MVGSIVIEIWRQDAVYSFDFWPGAEVAPPTELKFELEHARFTIGYAHESDWLFESAREIAEATEKRVAAHASPSLPIVASRARSVEGCAGEAWSSTVELEGVGTIAHVIGCDMGGGVVARLDLEYGAPPTAEPDIETMENLARRIERQQMAKLIPDEVEQEYILGPLRLLAPRDWRLSPTADSELTGEQGWVDLHQLTFEFSNGPDAPSSWLQIPAYVDRMLLIGGSIAEGSLEHITFADGRASAISRAALPPPDDDDPDDVDTEAVVVIEWPNGTACKLTAIQDFPHHLFDRTRDLARLRDLLLRISASSRCRPRPVD